MTDIKDIIDAAHSPKKGGHSALYWHLWKHHAALAPALNHRGSNWAGIAVKIAASGILDGRGKPPTGRTMRETWRKVDQVKKNGPKKRKARVDRSGVNRAFRVSSARKQ